MTLNFWSYCFCPSSGSWECKVMSPGLEESTFVYWAISPNPEGLWILILLSHYMQNKSVNNPSPFSSKMWVIQFVIFQQSSVFFKVCSSGLFLFLFFQLFPLSPLPLWQPVTLMIIRPSEEMNQPKTLPTSNISVLSNDLWFGVQSY